MKSLIIFLIGAIAGAVALNFYQRHRASTTPPPKAVAPAAPAPAKASPESSSLEQKLKEWRLTPADIKQDIAKTGKVVRSKAAEVGSRMSDARIVAVVKAKYVLDSGLSALAINVDCHDGEVVLNGTVKSPDLIGRAVALALETDGVKNVVSRLKVSK